ncbi:MAG: homocysteine S-methyltransferase family protein [Bacillota bacterium]
MKSLAEAVKNDVLLLDGAMGTQLQEAGLPPGVAPEWWNLAEPAKVEAIHRAYREAGAQMLETNTFGANPIKLAHFGLAAQAAEINRAAVELARKAAGEEAWVVASVGPTGRVLAPLGDLDPEEAAAAFTLQASALAAAGVDAINIETMADMVEMRLALLAALSTGLPVMAEFTFEPNGRTLFGSPPEAVGAFLAGFPLLAAGINCGLTPDLVPPVLEGIGATWPGPLIVQPNAGRPGSYLGPEEFAAATASLQEKGASVLGGCCGTGPAHIAHLRRALSSYPSLRPRQKEPLPFLASRTAARKVAFLPPGPVIAVKDEDQDLLTEALACQEAEVVVFDLTSARMAPRLLRETLAGLWPVLRPPVIFYASNPEVLAAAILSYPGRPGATGDPSLAGKARELGALWFA